jgi:beta-aspartyl-peptidase (threonine type)
VSSTGHGEYFIRVAVAKTICARMELLNEGPVAAARSALEQVAELGGDGGVIVLDGNGRYGYVFNSPGMYRGMIDPNTIETAIFEAK